MTPDEQHREELQKRGENHRNRPVPPQRYTGEIRLSGLPKQKRRDTINQNNL